MNYKKSLRNKISRVVFCTLIGVLSCSSMSFAQSNSIPATEVEPPAPANGSAADLIDLETRSNSGNNWGMGGQQNWQPTSESPYNQNSPSPNPSALDRQESDRQWQNTNRGDTPNSGGKIPITRF